MATPYQTWIQNPGAFSARKLRDQTYGEEPAEDVLDIEGFQRDWDAGKALYADRNNPGIAARDVYNPTMSLEQWLSTNPNITTNPENDYMNSQYLIPQQGLDVFGSYAPFIAMAAMGGAAAMGAGGGAGAAGASAGGGSSLAGSGLSAWEAASAPSLASQGAWGAATGNAGLSGLEALGATGAAGAANYAPVADLATGGGVPVSDLTQLPAGGLPAASSGGAPSGGLFSKLVQGGASTFGIPNNLLLGGFQAGLGYLGSKAQADAYKDVAAQQGQYSAGARARLEAAQQPGFSMMNLPGYADAVNRAADISTRQWAARAGNPAGNPTAQAGIYREVLNERSIPDYFNYLGLQGQHAGLGLNTSAQASMAAAGQEGGMYNALGYGLNTALNPQPSYEDILKKYGLTVGGVPA